MAYLPVPNYPFAPRTAPLPLSQLDADLLYASGKAVSVKDFGVVGSGADESIKVQEAVDYVQATNQGRGRLYFPSGVYSIQNIQITKPIDVYGDGGATVELGTGTRLAPATNGATLFTVNCLGGVTFRDFSVLGFPQVSGDAFVIKNDNAAASGVGNLGTLFDNIRFDSMFTAIKFENALNYFVRSCGFWNVVSRGITVTNTFSADQGDGCIEGNYFGSGGVGAVALYWDKGGAGLRFTNNKTLMANAIVADVSCPVATGQMTIANNSFDNGVTGIVSIIQSGGVNTFGAIIITGNIFAGYAGMSRQLDVRGIAGAHINTVVIANNVFLQIGGPLGTVVSGNFLDELTISDNIITSTLGSGIGIELGPNIVNGMIGGNTINGMGATPVVNLSGPATLELVRAGNGWQRLFMDFTNTATVGAVVMNKASGRVNVAAGVATVVVTNNLVTAASKVLAVAAATDANNLSVRSVIPAAGSFTITLTAAPAANLPVDFFLINVD